MSETVGAGLPRTLEFAGFWRSRGMPVLLALAIHGLAALLLVRGWAPESEPLSAQRFDSINATLLTMEARAPEPAPPPAPPRAAPPQAVPPKPAAARPLPTEPEPARPQRRQEPRPQPEPSRADPAPEPEPAEPDAAPEPADERWREAIGSSFDSALDEEAARLAEQRADSATASYVAAIIARIERNWSRPPSARLGMEVELLMGLVPTGELVAVDIVRSSGNAAFDRSAEIAVRQAAPFQVPSDPELFESRFRRLRVVFNPEDLRK